MHELPISSMGGHHRPVQAGSAPPRFEGMTRWIKGKRWLSERTISDLLKVVQTPNIGDVPKPLLDAANGDAKRIYTGLTELTRLLRPLAYTNYFPPPWYQRLLMGTPKPPKLAFRIGETGKPITMQYIGRGQYGAVFKLKIAGGPAYALKVFHTPEDSREVHGTLPESGTALYFSEWAFQDASRFFFGNLTEGWNVFEFISKREKASRRPGGKLADRLDVQLADQDGSKAKDNTSRGIRLDWGGVTHPFKLNEPVKTLDDFLRQLNNPHYEKAAANALRHIPEAIQLDAYKALLERSGTRKQVGPNIWALEQANRDEAFLAAMQYPDLRADLANCMGHTSEAFQPKALEMVKPYPECYPHILHYLKHQKRDAEIEALAPTYFKQVMADPERHPIASGLIQYLPESQRLEAYKTVLQSDHAREVSYHVISHLSPADQVAGLKAALVYPDRRAEVAWDIRDLDPANQKEAIELAVTYPECRRVVADNMLGYEDGLRKLVFDLTIVHPESQAAAAAEIKWLEEADRVEAFNKAMAYPAARANAADCISSLPQGRDRKGEALKAAYIEAMKYPESRATAPKELGMLPRDFLPEAFRMALAYPESRAEATRAIHWFEKPDQRQFFLEAMAYPDAQLAAGEAIGFLPKYQKQAAIQYYVDAAWENHCPHLKRIPDGTLTRTYQQLKQRLMGFRAPKAAEKK